MGFFFFACLYGFLTSEMCLYVNTIYGFLISEMSLYVITIYKY